MTSSPRCMRCRCSAGCPLTASGTTASSPITRTSTTARAMNRRLIDPPPADDSIHYRPSALPLGPHFLQIAVEGELRDPERRRGALHTAPDEEEAALVHQTHLSQPVLAVHEPGRLAHLRH